MDGHLIAVNRCADDSALPEPLRGAVDLADGHGDTVVVVTADERPLAVLTIGDGLRAGADSLVERLRRMGLRLLRGVRR